MNKTPPLPLVSDGMNGGRKKNDALDVGDDGRGGKINVSRRGEAAGGGSGGGGWTFFSLCVCVCSARFFKWGNATSLPLMGWMFTAPTDLLLLIQESM